MARTRICVTGDCPESHMDDGSHSEGWQDGDWCDWCGDKQEARQHGWPKNADQRMFTSLTWAEGYRAGYEDATPRTLETAGDETT